MVNAGIGRTDRKEKAGKGKAGGTEFPRPVVKQEAGLFAGIA
jgi:hypothetical protein